MRARARRALIALLAGALGAGALGAQTIRGTVIDDASRRPIPQVLVSLVDDAGTEVQPGARSDSLGAFILHAARAGTWRVKAVRIGYTPVTSDRVSLAVGGLAVVRLRMTTVAQQLVPVQVVEQRQLSANELMSTSGFDLRERRGLGRFLSGDRLAAMGRDGVREILATHFQPTLFVLNDSVVGEVLRLRQGLSPCAPEIYLDGRLLATAPERPAIFETTPLLTNLDSVRFQTRQESDRIRLEFGQVNALNQLSALTANLLHGIEVYRASEVPPASLGAWFGMTKASLKACGSVAVWTKAGARSVVNARNLTAAGSALQVISGTLLDNDTGTPVAGRSVFLLSESRDAIGAPVVTDERGDFTVRTGRAGVLRLQAGGSDYLVSTSPPFRVSANELVVVKLFVSASKGVLAPLGVAARVLPQNIGLTSLSGFTYRRERGQGGSFFRAVDLERAGVRSVPELVRTAPGPARGCAATYYVDGARLGENAEATVAAIPVNRVLGVEIYTRAADIPTVFGEGGDCGLVVIWRKR